MVKLNKIYTRTGDSGTAGLVDGRRVAKSSLRMAAIGEVDEANAAIGVAIAALDGGETALALARVQNELFDLGADLATPIVPDPAYPPLRVTQDYIDRLEADCDAFNAELTALTSFILPGGTSAAALLHLARTVARRAERSAWALRQVDPERSNPLAATYLNRLSDLLFILSRVANPAGDVMWVPGGDRAGREKQDS